ncbi:MAG: DUF2267 domain-containing protein [Bacteroidales bacterium]
MGLNFEKFAQEGNVFVKNLAANLGHPEETARTGILLRAVLHTLRDRLQIGESLDFLSQLPMCLKAVYVDNWKTIKTSNIETVEEFTDEVKRRQDEYGEMKFSWSKSTRELTAIVLKELGTYISAGEAGHVISQMPKELKSLFEESMK